MRIGAALLASLRRQLEDYHVFSKAARAADSQAIWNVETPQGGYRLVAKGAKGKASVVYLLSLEFPEIQ